MGSANSAARRFACVIASAVAIAMTSSGCTDDSPTVTPTQSASPSASSQASSAPTAAPAPSLRPGGTAADNLAYFTSVNTAFLASNPMPGGRAIIDNLVAAGFDKALMQVTPDTTAIGRDVDSVQFSVRFDEECLIGQASTSAYAGTVGPAVSGTACLLGVTRAIDW